MGLSGGAAASCCQGVGAPRGSSCSFLLVSLEPTPGRDVRGAGQVTVRYSTPPRGLARPAVSNRWENSERVEEARPTTAQLAGRGDGESPADGMGRALATPFVSLVMPRLATAKLHFHSHVQAVLIVPTLQQGLQLCRSRLRAAGPAASPLVTAGGRQQHGSAPNARFSPRADKHHANYTPSCHSDSRTF